MKNKRPGGPPKIDGVLTKWEVYELFGAHVVRGVVRKGENYTLFTAEIRCFDSALDGSRTSYLWTSE